MNIQPIRSDADLMAALAEVDQLMQSDPELGSLAGDKLDVLATLIEAYESKNFPIEKPDPIEAIRFRMDQSGLGVTDLVPLIGNPNRVYEVLNGKRPLTLRMIRNLNRELGIPATALIA
jgi:HTH-type transcriptional regulator/antitoxin HigA